MQPVVAVCHQLLRDACLATTAKDMPATQQNARDMRKECLAVTLEPNNCKNVATVCMLSDKSNTEVQQVTPRMMELLPKDHSSWWPCSQGGGGGWREVKRCWKRCGIAGRFRYKSLDNSLLYRTLLQWAGMGHSSAGMGITQTIFSKATGACLGRCTRVPLFCVT